VRETQVANFAALGPQQQAQLDIHSQSNFVPSFAERPLSPEAIQQATLKASS